MDLFDLSDWLEQCSKDCKKEIEKEVGKSAKMVQAQAKLLVPVDTGNLHNNINTSVKWEGNKCIGVISANTEYAPYVEYGTGIYSSFGTGRQTPWVYPYKDGFRWTQGQQPQPFMYPAWMNTKDKIFNDISDLVGRLLK